MKLNSISFKGGSVRRNALAGPPGSLCVRLLLEPDMRDSEAAAFARAFVQESDTQREDVQLLVDGNRHVLKVCAGPITLGENWYDRSALAMIERAADRSGVEVRDVDFGCAR